MILTGLLVVVLLAAAALDACKVLQNGGPTNALLNKKSPSDVPICMILNDRYLFTSQVQFDVYSRIVIPGSFDAVTAPAACGAPASIWFPPPLSCTWKDGTYGDGLGLGAPTNFYASVQGISSSYRKRYAYVTPAGHPTAAPTTAQNVVGIFPIVTLVIKVNSGIVTEVFWDDDCYFNANRKAGTSSGADSMDCAFNAYEIDNRFTNIRNQTYRALLNPTAGSTNGYDTMLTVAACKNNVFKDSSSTTPAAPTNEVLPVGFCDLGIYVTWVGTSADGQQLGSASPRFKRFRDYAMLAQYPTMLNFQGHSLQSTVETGAPSVAP